MPPPSSGDPPGAPPGPTWTAPAPPEPPAGYRLGRRLGAGSFGEVWEAVGPGGSTVALKFLDCRSWRREVVAAEVRVLRALAGLRHPHIIGLQGVFAVSRYVVLCMERAECSLADLHRCCLKETGRNVPPGRLLDLLEQAAEALDFLAGLRLPGLNSGSGVLQHADVKPSNLLLVGETLKVADFGLCAGSGWGGRGGLRGTPPYAAPELYQGRPSAHTDQYALAVTFCELAAGGRPFRKLPAGKGYPGVPVDPMKLRAREAVVINRALHPEPCLRWPSCRAFLSALREAARAHRAPTRGRSQ